MTDSLVKMLTDEKSSDRLRASTSLVLARTLPARITIRRLLDPLVSSNATTRNWVLATLAQMNPADLRQEIDNPALLDQLAPLLLNSPETNWTKSERVVDRIKFVRQQALD